MTLHAGPPAPLCVGGGPTQAGEHRARMTFDCGHGARCTDHLRWHIEATQNREGCAQKVTAAIDRTLAPLFDGLVAFQDRFATLMAEMGEAFVAAVETMRPHLERIADLVEEGRRAGLAPPAAGRPKG